MKTEEVKELIGKRYPELKIFDKWEGERWHLHTYLESEQGTLGIETVFTPTILSVASSEELEKFINVLRSAFLRKLSKQGEKDEH